MGRYLDSEGITHLYEKVKSALNGTDTTAATDAANAAASAAMTAADNAQAEADAASKRLEELNDTNVGKLESRVSTLEGEFTKETTRAETAEKSLEDKKADKTALDSSNARIKSLEDKNLDKRVTELEANINKLRGKYVGETCGRYWDFNNNTPRAAGYVGNLQMLKDIPDLLNLGGYLVKNDHSRRKLSSVNHHYYQDGTPAKLDGTEGHYQFGWNCKWYMKPSWDETTKIFKIEFSITPMEGWYKVPVGSNSASGWAAIDRINNILVSYCNKSTQYRGGNNNSSYDGKYNSLLGMPASNQTTANFMAMAQKNGSGWLSSTGRMTCAINILIALIMGDLKVDDTRITELDSNGLRQGGLGSHSSFGWSQWSSHNGNNPLIPMDAGADKGDYLGTINYDFELSDGTKETWNIPCFFGYKDFYVFLWRGTCDEFLECNADCSQTHYYVEEPYYTKFTFGSKDNAKKGTTGPASNGWMFISRLVLANFEMMPTEVNGSANSLFSDGYYNPHSTSGLRLCLRAAGANHGDNTGCWFLRGDLGFGDTGVDWGSSLSEVCEGFKATALTKADIESMIG